MNRWELYVKFKGEVNWELVDTFKTLTSCTTCVQSLQDSKVGRLKVLDKVNGREAYL